MVDKFATVRGRESTLNLSQVPLVVAHKPFDRFLHKRLRIAATLLGEASEFSLQIGPDIHFHETRVKTARAAVNPAI